MPEEKVGQKCKLKEIDKQEMILTAKLRNTNY